MRPSPLARWAVRGGLLGLVLMAAELAWRGHFVASPMLLALAGVFAMACRRALSRHAHSARRVLLAADGRWHVMTVGGRVEPVSLDPGALRLGGHLLLLLRGSVEHRVLLGPDNLDPATLAALGRRLAAGMVPEATAIHSVHTSRAGSHRLP